MDEILNEGYELVIGLEIHAQLNTQTKIFCGCPNQFGGQPNHHTCPVCLGLPGALPVLNEKALEFAIRAGLAMNCAICNESVFARKNYFYPDLPKGYQISQFEKPICGPGWVTISPNGKEKRITLTRIHLEEDAGKLVHDASGKSLVDLNRAGTPLIEIVSEPDMRSPLEAGLFLRAVHQMVRYLEISDGNMEEGSLRCDANISLRTMGESKLGTKVELKNLNSFKFIEKAIEFEALRQLDIYLDGGTLIQETRLYDSDRHQTLPMRTKELAHDYRYFPDPDLQPACFPMTWVEEIKESQPELPAEKQKRYVEDWKLPLYDAQVLTQEPQHAHFFETTISLFADDTKKEVSHWAKLSSNWIMGEVTRYLNDEKIEIQQTQLTPKHLSSLIQCIDQGKINQKTAKDILSKIFQSGQDPETIIQKEGLEQVSDTKEIEKMVMDMIHQHPEEAEQFRQGKQKVLGFFMGQIMKKTKGKANPKIVQEILKDKINSTP